MCLDLLFETSSLKEWKQIAILWQAKRRKRNYFARLGLPRDFSAFGSAKGPVNVSVCRGTSHRLGLSRDLSPFGSVEGSLCGRIKVTAVGVGSTMKSLGLNTNCQAAIQP